MVAVTWVTQPPTGQPASLPANLWRVQRDVPIGTALGGTVADTWSAPTIISRYSADGNDLALADGAVTTVKLALSSTTELTTYYDADAPNLTTNGEHVLATVSGTTGTGYSAVVEANGWFSVNSSVAGSEPHVGARLYRGIVDKDNRIGHSSTRALRIGNPVHGFSVGAVASDFSGTPSSFTITAFVSELMAMDSVLPWNIRLSLLVAKR